MLAPALRRNVLCASPSHAVGRTISITYTTRNRWMVCASGTTMTAVLCVCPAFRIQQSGESAPKAATECSKLSSPSQHMTTDAELYDIIVCQVDHRIICDAWRSISHGNNTSQESLCKTMKWVKPVARCIGFDASVWNAGATCIANTVHRSRNASGPVAGCGSMFMRGLVSVGKQCLATSMRANRWHWAWLSTTDAGRVLTSTANYRTSNSIM